MLNTADIALRENASRFQPLPERTPTQRYSERALEVVAALSLVFAAALLPLIMLGAVSVLTGFVAMGGLICFSFFVYQTSFKVFRDSPEARNEKETVNRELEAGKSLEDIIKSWTPDYLLPKIFRYGLISKEVFKEKYLESMNTKPLCEICDFYRQVSFYYKQSVAETEIFYEIPHPSLWRSKWKVETQEMSFTNIIKKYKLEDLEKYDIILDTAELSLLKRLEVAFKEDSSESNQNLLNDQYEALRA